MCKHVSHTTYHIPKNARIALRGVFIFQSSAFHKIQSIKLCGDGAGDCALQGRLYYCGGVGTAMRIYIGQSPQKEPATPLLAREASRRLSLHGPLLWQLRHVLALPTLCVPQEQ